MTTNNIVKKFFSCNCNTEGLLFTYDPEFKDVTVCLWNQGKYEPRMDWKTRLRWCWAIMMGKNPYEDDICMSIEEARLFAKTVLATVGEEA